MRGMRRAHALLALAGGLTLSGCKTEEPAAPSVQDAQGDWEDSGRYAACEFLPGKAACGDLAGFELSGCDAASLGQVAPEGIFTLVSRSDGSTTPSINADAFRLSSDGQLDKYHGLAPTERRVSAEGFFLSSTRKVSSSTVTRNSVVGCRAEGDRLYGCYVNCRNGSPTGSGTFQAVKWTRHAGEDEASGLRLASESFVEQGGPVDVYVTKGHAYVVSLPEGSNPGGLTVFDVSNPAAPVKRTTISLSSDNYWNGVWSKDDALYVASASSGVVVFDISNPADPQLVRSYPSSVGLIDVHTVYVDGDRLYAMSPGPVPKTLLFDIRKPLEPVLLGEYLEPGAGDDPRVGYPHDGLALEGRLYINHWSGGYVIVDVSDAAHPKKLGGFAYPYATSHANAVGRFGERLIAFEGGENWGAHLRVLDVTDPAQPKRIGEFKLDENVSIHNMVLKGERLYIAHYQNGVRVLDVSEPEHPKQLAYFNTFRETDAGRGESFYDGAIGIRVPGDGYIYSIDTARGLLIYPEP